MVISAGILWLLLREAGGASTQEGLQALWTIGWGVWVMYAFAQLLQGWLRAIRYRLLLAGAGANPLPGPGRMFGVTLARNMFVDMLPARAGELMYWALLNRGEGVKSDDCVSSMTLSIWFDFLALVVVLGIAVGAPMLEGDGRILMLWGVFVVGVVVVVGAVALFYGPCWAVWILEHFPARIRQWKPVEGLARFMANLSESFHQVRGSGVMGKVTLLSIGIRIVKYAGLAVAFYGVATVLRPALTDLPVWQMLIGLISGEGGAALPIPTFLSLGIVLLGTHIVSQLVDYSLGGLALLGLLWGKRRTV